MRAVRLKQWGIENIELDEVPDVAAAPGEVLIATEAATINPADLQLVKGNMASWLPDTISAPYTPGWDLAGRVAAVGDGVEESLVGAQVVGFSTWVEAGHGTQASLVSLSREHVAIAHNGVPSAHLTTVSLNGLTAWAAIKALDLSEGETLVVAGAAGSVAGFAVQLAAAAGARVVGYASERDRDYVLSMGATDLAAREDGEIGVAVREILPDGADALFDTTTSIGAAGLAAIRDGGRQVTSTDPPEPERGITPTKIYGAPDGDALQRLVDMASDGRLQTPVAHEFDASEARQAYEHFASQSHRGRIVLTF